MIIFEDFEKFEMDVLSDFITICRCGVFSHVHLNFSSNYAKNLRITLVFGMLAIADPNAQLPRSVDAVLRKQIFTFQESRFLLDQLVDKVSVYLLRLTQFH